MKMNKHVIFDIENRRFKYLQREELVRKVDMNDLNKKLNYSKKINFYNNTKIIIFLFVCVSIFALISSKF